MFHLLFLLRAKNGSSIKLRMTKLTKPCFAETSYPSPRFSRICLIHHHLTHPWQHGLTRWFDFTATFPLEDLMQTHGPSWNSLGLWLNHLGQNHNTSSISWCRGASDGREDAEEVLMLGHHRIMLSTYN